jgi:hypothetical protein
MRTDCRRSRMDGCSAKAVTGASTTRSRSRGRPAAPAIGPSERRTCGRGAPPWAWEHLQPWRDRRRTSRRRSPRRSAGFAGSAGPLLRGGRPAWKPGIVAGGPPTARGISSTSVMTPPRARRRATRIAEGSSGVPLSRRRVPLCEPTRAHRSGAARASRMESERSPPRVQPSTGRVPQCAGDAAAALRPKDQERRVDAPSRSLDRTRCPDGRLHSGCVEAWPPAGWTQHPGSRRNCDATPWAA